MLTNVEPPKALAMGLMIATALLTTALALATQPGRISCGTSPQQGWAEFVDQAHGFCFWYPSKYRIAFTRDVPKGAEAKLVSSASRHAYADDREGASIKVGLSPEAFNLELLVRDAPTGIVTPPAPMHFGANTFYYYGKSTAGVTYPDVYYFNLHGQTLELKFDGPYGGENSSPINETKQIETRVLASFGRFSPSSRAPKF